MVLLSRWARSAAILVTGICCFARGAAGDGSGTISTRQIQANPVGVTFDYKLAWVDVQSSTFGVSMQVNAQPTYINGTKWSLLIRYDPSAKANIIQVTDGWGLGIYDYSSWAFLPSKDPFNIMYFTVHSSGQMNLEDTVLKLAEPTYFFLALSTGSGSSFSSGYELKKDLDYTINRGVNFAEIPKARFGPWLSLSNVPPEARITFAPSAQPTKTGAATSGDISVIRTGDATPLSPTSTPTSSTKPTSTATDDGDAASSTVLPPAKYIPGDPNYDRSVNPIGTQLTGSHIGLYLVSAILGIGILAHALGTIRRFQYKRQYHLSVRHSKAGSLLV
ncbi:hypothetical protein LPJ60_002764 [Coemansia sp. RSA 2675]|uniref:Uncharacterized protein n=1 Tax=Coemansia linderi TaxID=2663919 RepID=A0ACC1KD21_9FUNG|nr:hypothetical protein LPJ60_002764 [Coemansia sp. RSA 2675]KAJ2785268.1 hypothetical protein GGI18_003359 [Coemansia linderi]